MNAFQMLGLGFIIVVLLRIFFSIRAHRITPRAGWSWLLLWVCAAAMISQPGLTVLVARWLGIGRGADLVFYGAILGMLIGFYIIFVRLQRLEENITRIVRHLAIEEKAHPEKYLSET